MKPNNWHSSGPADLWIALVVIMILAAAAIPSFSKAKKDFKQREIQRMAARYHQPQPQ